MRDAKLGKCLFLSVETMNSGITPLYPAVGCGHMCRASTKLEPVALEPTGIEAIANTSGLILVVAHLLTCFWYWIGRSTEAGWGARDTDGEIISLYSLLVVSDQSHFSFWGFAFKPFSSLFFGPSARVFLFCRSKAGEVG